MENLFSGLSSLLPSNLSLTAMAKFILFFAAAMIVIGFIGRLCFGKKSDLNRSLSAGIGILFIYAVTIVIYSFDPADLSRFLSPLPYVAFSGDYLYLFTFAGVRFQVICSQILSMIVLAFLYNLIDDFMPEGKKLLHWLLYRILTILMAMVLHYVVTWLSNTFLPGPLVSYAPTMLVVVLGVTLLLGALKVLLGLVLAAVNPIIAAIYAFFFSHKLGKQLSRAVLTTAVLSVTVELLRYFGYAAISISGAALLTYLPLIAALLVLWYLLGHAL